MDSPKVTERLHIPEYGIDPSEEGLLDWQWVNHILGKEWNFWVCTTCPDGSPHATPVWGIWLDNRFYFGGGSKTKKARNLSQNPQIVIHTETKDEVVIVEGKAKIEKSKEITNKVQTKYKIKYDLDHPPPFWVVIPQKVLGWKAHTPHEFQSTPTRWRF